LLVDAGSCSSEILSVGVSPATLIANPRNAVKQE